LASRHSTADTDEVATLLETLAAELERPRELSGRVANYICGNYGIDPDDVGRFLVAALPKLEDYEIDLILSPVFTPKFEDQTVFAELLGDASVPSDRWPELIRQLTARPIRAQLVTNDGRTHSVVLRDVTIERYVHRLRLDATIPGSLLKLIDETPSADRPVLKAVARRAIWENDARRDILERYLTSSADRNSYSLVDALDLLNLIEASKPDNIADLLERIPKRQEVLRGSISIASGGKPFFSSRVEYMHGGDRDQRPLKDERTSAKENELAFLDRMLHILQPS
jgi:hypothetical protein